MDSILKIAVFFMLIFPTIYQAVAGFSVKEQKQVKKLGLRSAIMQLISTILAYFISLKIGQDKQVAIYVGFIFFLSLIILILIQNILIYINKNNS